MDLRRFTLALCAIALISAGSRGLAAPKPAAMATAPMDLTTGKTDATALGMEGSEAFFPQSPPQTVEGVLVSVDATGTVATVRTLRDGDVKIGVPPNIYVSRGGRESAIGDMKPGDRVYATVVCTNGVRAIRLVSEVPPNAMMNYVGIPVLCVLALGIWRVRSGPAKPTKGAATRK
jgi:hypothetical protein